MAPPNEVTSPGHRISKPSHNRAAKKMDKKLINSLELGFNQGVLPMAAILDAAGDAENDDDEVENLRKQLAEKDAAIEEGRIRFETAEERYSKAQAKFEKENEENRALKLDVMIYKRYAKHWESVAGKYEEIVESYKERRYDEAEEAEIAAQMEEDEADEGEYGFGGDEGEDSLW